MPRVEIKIAGFGGQGVVTLGRFIVFTAYGSGKYATETIAYGGEARGGSSWADVVVDDEEVDHPRCTQPDIAIILSQEAAATFAGTVRDKGLVLYDPVTVEKLSPREGARVFAIPATNTAREALKMAVVANTVMFGAFVALSRLFPRESAEKGIQSTVPSQAVGINLQAFHMGLEIAERMEGG
jgi:Pyruvate/2-oxoacid:ferredoxin oxidoreductase gamma subunit